MPGQYVIEDGLKRYEFEDGSRCDISLPLRLDDGQIVALLGSQWSIVQDILDRLDSINANTNDKTVTARPTAGSLTDRSGTITTGGTSQVLAAQNLSRAYLFVQNISEETLFLNFGTSATNNESTPNSIEIKPNQSVTFVSFVSSDQIFVLGETTGSKFIAKEG